MRGDYKYCPECAFRLRRRGPEGAEPQPAGPGTLIVGLVALLLLGAGIFVGTTVLRDSSPVHVIPEPPAEATQTVLNLADQLAVIDKGVAYYATGEVLVAPSEDAAYVSLLRRLAPEQRAHLLSQLDTNPWVYTRWSRMLSLFYDATLDLLQAKERALPIYTAPFKCMRYEVSRGQYKEFLRAVEQDPGMFARLAWVTWIRRGETPPDAEDATRAAAVWYALRYREAWWTGVLERYKLRDNLRRQAEWQLLESQQGPPAKAAPADGEPPTWEAIPPAPPPVRPAWLGPEESATQADLAAMTDALALYLLAPPDWIRVQDDGSLTWGDDERNDDLPVTGISWYDAHMFTVWARKRTGINRLRLPNWREWQRVFHGGEPDREPDDFDETRAEGRKWPWGNDLDPHGCNNLNHAWNADTPRVRGVREPYGYHRGQTVDGIMNMAGNAAEWTNNVSEEEFLLKGGTYYVSAPDENEATADLAFACGGSYLLGIDDCSVQGLESLRKTDRRIDVGFRLVADVGF